MVMNIVRFLVKFPVRVRLMIWAVFWAFSPRNILVKAMFFIVKTVINIQYCYYCNTASFNSFKLMNILTRIWCFVHNLILNRDFSAECLKLMNILLLVSYRDTADCEAECKRNSILFVREILQFFYISM